MCVNTRGGPQAVKYHLMIAAILVALFAVACSDQVATDQAALDQASDFSPIAPLSPPPTEPAALPESVVASAVTDTTTAPTTTAPKADEPQREPPPPLPPVSEPFTASESEPYAEAKTVAGRIAQRLLTYDPGTTSAQLAFDVAHFGHQMPELVAALRPALQEDRQSRATVVYPQLGGIADDRMSVMVVTRQDLGVSDDLEDTVTRTLDIRLVDRDGRWVFDGLASAGGDPTTRPEELSNIAERVLDHPDIELPDSARWDIYRGLISSSLLRVMADLGDQSSYGVVTLTTGHPHNVFGTDSMSRHTTGHAVDVYRIGDTRVIDGRAKGSPIHTLATELCTQDTVSSIGSPWRFELPESEEQAEEQADQYLCRSFTNSVHQDHIHISVAGSS